MTNQFINFESVTEWNHLTLSEDLFRRKHQGPLIEFTKEAAALIKNVQSHLSFIEVISKQGTKSEEERVLHSERLLQEVKLKKEKLEHDINKIENENKILKASFIEMKDRVNTLQAEANELMQLKKVFSSEVKSTYNAFILAKDFYKDKLKMYYTIEGSPDADEVTVLVEFFTSKRRKEPKNSVTIVRTKSDGKFKLIAMNPQLSVFPKLSKKLQETNDISGLLCCTRKCFMNLHA